jgi:hypothetical protein
MKRPVGKVIRECQAFIKRLKAGENPECVWGES